MKEWKVKLRVKVTAVVNSVSSDGPRCTYRCR